MKTTVSGVIPIRVLAGFVIAVAMNVTSVFGQVAAVDSTTASQSIRITVTSARDTVPKSADSLASAVDSLTKPVDSLAVKTDTTGLRKDTISAKKDTLEILSSTASYNTIPGFRVQVLTTQDLNQAIGVKTEADSLLPGYNVYIVYDSPYYKVRVGDFRARYEANQAVTYIAGHGFPDAWSVPDNIFRNPARRGN